MSPCRHILAVAALLLVSFAPAQTTDTTKKIDDSAEQAEVRFTDDSVVRMNILQEQVDIVTKYGKLTIPTSDIVKIDFGIRIPAEMEANINKAVDDLGSDNYKTRETAMKDLISWGPYAYPLLRKASKSDQPEVKKRALLAIDKVKSKHPARNLRLREEDIIVTPNFTVVGRISTATVKAKAENFGQLELKLTKLRGIRWLNAAHEVVVNIDAGRYAVANQWLDSGFEVRQNSRLHVVATGTIDLWPQNGGYISGPAGFGGVGVAVPRVKNGAGQVFPPGALIGRIGEDGPSFLIGDRYESGTDREGKLYLQIVPSPWNPNGSNGSYAVTIEPRSEFGGD